MKTRLEIRPGHYMNVMIYPNSNSQRTAFLIHGMGGRGDQWRDQIPLLQKDYSLIIPDLLGQGDSDKLKLSNPNPYDFCAFDQDLQTLFLKFATEDNIILGHSYGGALATSFALDHQDRVNKLILIAPLPCEPKQIPRLFHLPSPILELMRPIFEKSFVQLSFVDKESTVVKEETQAAKTNPMYVIKGILEGMRHIPHIDVTMLRLPTLILLGDQDGLVPAMDSQQFYSALPQHEIVIFPNASHMCLLENSKEVNEKIAEFLGL